MSLPIDVGDLIHQKKVERTRIEYKSEWNPEPIIHTITAFANVYLNWFDMPKTKSLICFTCPSGPLSVPGLFCRELSFLP